MNKVKNFLLTFSIVGLLVLVSITKVKAQYGCDSGASTNACVRCCAQFCEDTPGLQDCREATTGEERSDCRLLNNIMIQCCNHDCMEADCGLEAGDSIVCEALEDICLPPPT